MNIGTSESPQKGIGINGYFSRTNLTIYGQSLDEATAGQLSIYTDAAPTVNDNGILIQGTYTQHSGNVTITALTMLSQLMATSPSMAASSTPPLA